MTIRATWFFSVVLFTLTGALAQDDPAAGQEKIVLLEPPKSVKEALERQKTAEAAAAAKLTEAEAAYSAEVDKANKQLVMELEQLAKIAVANGDIKAAANAWTSVLEVDKSNENATHFFEVIGRTDVIKKTKPEPARPVKRQEYMDSEGRVFRQTTSRSWWDSHDFETGSLTIAATPSYIVIKNPNSGTMTLLLDDQYLWATTTDQENRIWRIGKQGKWVK